MDPTRGVSAREWLLTADEAHIADVLKVHGEERAARPIARAIVARRLEAGEHAFLGTAELAALVAGSCGAAPDPQRRVKIRRRGPSRRFGFS